ncbi:MAG: DUF1015 domain-containing protein [Acidobacteria bacterium]|nr:DUF1015 domain-containing protein [Acidobacteriota bacterium]
MPTIHPFAPYQFSRDAGRLEELVVPSGGAVTLAHRQRYLSINPNNITRAFCAMGSQFEDSVEQSALASRKEFDLLIRRGILERRSTSSLFACFQNFRMPDSGELLTRKLLIGLGEVESYGSKNIYRHEQTLPQRKADQERFLQIAGIQFDPILMLYSDNEFSIEPIMDSVALNTTPVAEVMDDDQVLHRLYEISNPHCIAKIQTALHSQRLLIADGHHRYEAALALMHANRGLGEAFGVPMALANIREAGHRHLATHRVLNGLTNFSLGSFISSVKRRFVVVELDSVSDLVRWWSVDPGNHSHIGIVVPDSNGVTVLKSRCTARSNVEMLHDELIQGILGVSTSNADCGGLIHYVRGLEAATSMVRSGAGQVGFLLTPTPLEQVFSAVLDRGTLLPPKSTDFYPKVPSGLVMHLV